MTVDELEKFAREHGTWEDIFTTTSLLLPKGTRVLRDRAQIQRWLDACWEAPETSGGER
jgi:hypothetical protein